MSSNRRSHLGAQIVEFGHNPTIDIVFVHGLMGHPQKTWTGNPPATDTRSEHKKPWWRRFFEKKSPEEHASSPPQIFWPGQFLPQDIPYARIITYGYDAEIVDLFKSVCQNSLYAISRDILNDLQISRDTEVEISRPILWIAHSLGGIVVKDALNQSYALKQKQPHLFDIYSSTIGVIYLGTPHRGSGGADLGLIAASAASCFMQSPNKSLLRSLQSGSAELERISDTYSLLPRKIDKAIQEYSFQEDRGMASALPLIGGKVVPDSSSKLDDGVGNTSNIAANHRDMCKFVSRTSRDYLRVISVIKRLSKRRIPESTDSTSISVPELNQNRIEIRDRLNRRPGRDSYLEDGVGLNAILHSSDSDSSECLEMPPQVPRILRSQDANSSMFNPTKNKKKAKTPVLVSGDNGSEVPESSSKRKNLFFELPLLANHNFTGRKSHMEQLQLTFQHTPQAGTDCLQKQGLKDLRCALLLGMGGCGKTEIALNYARYHRNDYSAVLWVDGTSTKTLASSFRRISAVFPHQLLSNENGSSGLAASRNLSLVDLPASRLRAILNFDVTDWLRNCSGDSWLVIIDNMDDPDMIDEVEQLILPWHHGHVIITSRSQYASRLGSPIRVNEMEPFEATQLLVLSIESSLDGDGAEVLASTLATKLGNLPLAIDQAAAYINHQQMSMNEYLFLLEKEQAYLLGHPSRNRYHKTTQLERGQYDTVLTTWEISFKHIMRTQLQASLLLQLFAFMNFEEISEIIFSDINECRPWQAYGPDGELTQASLSDSSVDSKLMEVLTSKIKFREAIGSLLSFSLIRRRAQTRTLSIHPLVHFWTSWRMESSEKASWISRTVAILNLAVPIAKRFPPLEYTMTESDTRILPHVQTIYEVAKDTDMVQQPTVLAILVAYASYHTAHPTSHDMFAFAIKLVEQSQNVFPRLLVIYWGAASSCCKAPPCCRKSEYPLLRTMGSMPRESMEPWSVESKTPALNALYLRLAFNIEHARYKCKTLKSRFEYGSLLASVDRVAEGPTSSQQFMSTEKVMSCWCPTSANDLESQAQELQRILNIASGLVRIEVQDVARLEEALAESLKTTFAAVPSLHEPIWAGLFKLCLTVDRPFNSSLKAMSRMLEIPSEVGVLELWTPFADTAADLTLRAHNSEEKSQVLELFHRIEIRVSQEKSNSGRWEERPTRVSDKEWAKFGMLYKNFDLARADKDTILVARNNILLFLLSF